MRKYSGVYAVLALIASIFAIFHFGKQSSLFGLFFMAVAISSGILFWRGFPAEKP
jgi:hypothetical protein